MQVLNCKNVNLQYFKDLICCIFKLNEILSII